MGPTPPKSLKIIAHIQAKPAKRDELEKVLLSLIEPTRSDEGYQEYELFIDLRKFCKQSVSRLVACAIQQYLDKIIADMQGKTDDYPSISYLMEKVIKDGATCWILTWGISSKQVNRGPCIT